jgi:hypothetical protein
VVHAVADAGKQAWVQLLTTRSALEDMRRGPRRRRRREASVGAAAHDQELNAKGLLFPAINQM